MFGYPGRDALVFLYSRTCAFCLFGGGQTLSSDRAEEGPELLAALFLASQSQSVASWKNVVLARCSCRLLCCCHLSQHRWAQLMVGGLGLEGR